MAKKLISMIPTSGKSTAQIVSESWGAYARYWAEEEYGLAKCKLCGEYKGRTEDDGEVIEVDCLCAGVNCNWCGGGKVPHPISNYFNREDAKIWYASSSSKNICPNCKSRTMKE